MYERLNGMVNLPISRDQFYQLIRDHNTNKVKEQKKTEFINIIKENINVTEWLNQYLAMID